jgi:hypothetical protein
MSVLDEWNGIAARVAAAGDALDAMARLSTNGEDSYGVYKEVSRRNQASLIELREFEASHRAVLSERVRALLNGFVAGERAALINETPDPRRARAGSVFLGLLTGEVTRLLSDRDLVIRLRTERAFRHLKQIIATDAEVQVKWAAAFGAGEVACERLGATHLLWHGIFAFKADGAGARTDLVFSEPIDGGLVARTDSGLVLTEWKVSDGKDGLDKFEQARRQAEIYSAGALSGVELSGFRFAVVVSEKQLQAQQIPDDLLIGSVTYRHINIAIEPRKPSEQAKLKS